MTYLSYQHPPILAAVLLAAFTPLASGAKITIEVFDPPSSTHTVGVAINSTGYVTGYFTDSSKNYSIRAFLRYDNGDITVFDAPGSSATVPTTINAGGKIAGISTTVVSGQQVAFIRDARGAFITFTAPSGTVAPRAMNDQGVVAGDFYANADSKGFVRSASGQLVLFSPPGATNTSVTGINNTGVITGTFLKNGVAHGFIRDRLGSFLIFDVPKATGTWPVGINSSGQVAGYYTDSVHQTHGFLRSPQGAIELLDTATGLVTPSGINDFGRIAGQFSPLDPTKPPTGFERNEAGNLILIEVPNSRFTDVRSISLNSDLTGSYKEDLRGGLTHGFVAWVED